MFGLKKEEKTDFLSLVETRMKESVHIEAEKACSRGIKAFRSEAKDLIWKCKNDINQASIRATVNIIGDLKGDDINTIVPPENADLDMDSKDEASS